MPDSPLRLLSLSPLPAEMIAANLPDDLDVDVVTLEDRTVEGALEALPAADFVLGDFFNAVPVDEKVVAAMDRVRLFHHPATGYESVDADALARRGIPLTNAWRSGSVAMAEHTVMAALAMLKSLAWCDRQVRAGQWPQHEVVGRSLAELSGKTVGLVGLGGAGEETARRLSVFGCRVLYTARRRRPAEVEEELRIVWAELDELLASADVVCLLVDLNPQTRNMIDADALGRMKPTAFLVNPARGAVVDEQALITALHDGVIAGAAIDVFEHEPLPEGSPLRDLDNVLLTPHVGGASAESRDAIMRRAWDVITQAARGELPEGVVNGVAELRVPK